MGDITKDYALKYNQPVIDALSKDYESIWLIDVESQKMVIFKVNCEIVAPGSVDTAVGLTYDEARLWYISAFAHVNDRDRLISESSLDNVFKHLNAEDHYIVNYRRVIDEEINYNQLYYAPIEVVDGQMKCFLMGFRDVDNAKKAEVDDITEIFNRQAFISHAEKMLLRNLDKEFDLLLTDFVDFKQVNDKYGMKIGDSILREYGAYLRTRINNGVVVGRYGGDQFAMLVEHSILEKRLLDGDDLKMYITHENIEPVIIKYGIFRNVDHFESIVKACDKAHIALNTIKHSYGKNVATYSEELQERVDTIRRIESSMYEALEKEQFKVYYQPKCDAKTGKVVGAEALVRWIHPEYGFMSPGDFIPLFERNGFVTELDYYVWARTCKNIRRWKNTGVNTVPISVNASKLDFERADFLKVVRNAVEDNDISSSDLHVEITETLMEGNISSFLNILEKLKEEGFKIELDDFGSGYSSLNVLSEYPLDVVKLDMSFVKQLGDEKRFKVLTACINLARELGYSTVSEGVETQDQSDLLRELGVDAIQGYFYSRPMPEDEFEEYLRRA